MKPQNKQKGKEKRKKIVMAHYTTALQKKSQTKLSETGGAIAGADKGVAIDSAMEMVEENAAFDMKMSRPFDSDTLNTEIVKYVPSTNGWETNNEIEIKIPATDYQWLKLSSIRLYITFKIHKRDDSDFSTEIKNQKTLITANFVPMLFKKVDVVIGNSTTLLNHADYGLTVAMLRLLNNTTYDSETLKLNEYYESFSAGPNMDFITVDNDDITNAVKEKSGWRWELLDNQEHVVETDIFHYFLQQKKCYRHQFV